MRLNKAQHTFELELYYMATDKLILYNQQINSPAIKVTQCAQHNFSDYLGIYKFLLKNKTQHKSVHIYDITYNLQHSNNTEFLINDHINRAGENPFIGKQQFFDVDFINVENLYTQNPQGIITTCYGQRYAPNKTNAEFPSTHIANIAVLAQITNYTVTGSLINQL